MSLGNAIYISVVDFAIQSVKHIHSRLRYALKEP